MHTVIITIFVVYLFWFYIRPWLVRYARRKMEQRVRDMFARQFGEAFGGAPYGEEPPIARQERRGKKIPSDVGEYVDFEESSSPLPPPPAVNIRAEQQVTDIDWVEID